MVNPSAIQRHFYNAKRFAVILGSELWQMEKKTAIHLRYNQAEQAEHQKANENYLRGNFVFR